MTTLQAPSKCIGLYYRLLTTFFLFQLIFTNIAKAQLLTEAELQQVTKAIDGKTIVGLGEPEHFFSGYYELKSQIAKHLLKNTDINTLIFEASGASFRELDRYVRGENVDAKAILNDVNDGYRIQGYGLLNYQEILDLLDWIKQENKTRKNKISVMGMDFQQLNRPINALSYSFSDKPQFQAMLNKAKKNADTLMNIIITNPVKLYTNNDWKNFASEHYQLTEEIEKYVTTNSKDKNLRRDAAELRQFAYIYQDIDLNRDSIMAANISQIVEPKAKAIIWAANFHTGKDKINSSKGDKVSMGSHLNKKYGNQYFTIAVWEGMPKDSKARIVHTTSEMPEYKIHDLLIPCQKGQPSKPL